MATRRTRSHLGCVEAWLVVRIFHEVKPLYINYYYYYNWHKVKTLPGVLSLQVSPALSPVGVETLDELPHPHRGTRAEQFFFISSLFFIRFPHLEHSRVPGNPSATPSRTSCWRDRGSQGHQR